MKVVILCGGLGTRLREETEYRPKPLVEVGGRPILWHIMKLYAHHGFRDFVLCLGYRGNMIKEYFLNYEAMNNDFTICLGQLHQIAYHGAHCEQDFRVTLADTGQETMTGGRVRRIKQLRRRRHVHGHLRRRRRRRRHPGAARLPPRARPLATVTAVRPTSRFGVLDLADDGQRGAVRREAADRRLDQRRLLRLRPPGLRLPRRRRDASWSASRWSGWPRKGS